MFISFHKNEKNQSLWKRFIDGDKSAFGGIYSYYHKSLTVFCVGRLGNIDLAENAASETLIKLLEYPNPEKIENYENWIFAVAKNVCSTYQSKSTRRKNILNENYNFEINQSPEVESKMSVDNIDQLIRSNLDDRDYKIWQLHQQGYDNQEIADILDSTVKTVANRKSTARQKLKRVFKEINKEGHGSQI